MDLTDGYIRFNQINDHVYFHYKHHWFLLTIRFNFKKDCGILFHPKEYVREFLSNFTCKWTSFHLPVNLRDWTEQQLRGNNTRHGSSSYDCGIKYAKNITVFYHLSHDLKMRDTFVWPQVHLTMMMLMLMKTSLWVRFWSREASLVCSSSLSLNWVFTSRWDSCCLSDRKKCKRLFVKNMLKLRHKQDRHLRRTSW